METENYYIDNKQFLQELTKQHKIYEENSDAVISDELGQFFIDIAMNLANKKNFTYYTFKREMIGDAIENCLRYWKNFDVTRNTSPFSYFTQVCWCAFIRRIKLEARQSQIRETISANMELFETITDTQDLDSRKYSNLQLRKIQNDFQKNKQKQSEEKKKERVQKKKTNEINLKIFMI